MLQAAALAKLQEDKFNDSKRPFRPKPQPQTAIPQNPSQPPLLLSPPKPTFKHLTPAEMAARREKGLCYNCDEKWSNTHRCKSRFFLIVADDVDRLSEAQPQIAEEDVSSDPVDTGTSSAQISFHALSGHLALETLRVPGSVNGHKITVLIDGGSTHNFIQDTVARFLNLKVQPTLPLQVMVGNGSQINCCQFCEGVAVIMQGHKFIVDLYVMPLAGADLVFGVQWLKQLGPVVTDYSTLTMSFTRDGQPIELVGRSTFSPREITHQQVKRLISTNRAAEFLHIQMNPHPPPSSVDHTTLPPQIQTLLSQYSDLFTKPTSLPPSRATDHSIHLTQNSDPVNVRPYRYPYFQKQEIERQVEEMLLHGMIQPSRSPFSSPVLLVRKKDGT